MFCTENERKTCNVEKWAVKVAIIIMTLIEI
jgi:hypothetical protein